MRKIITLLTIILLVVFMVGCENSINPIKSQTQNTGERSLAKKGGVPANDGCVTIQDGTLMYSAGHFLDGQPLTIGYDIFGYNYQAHMFNGSFFNAYAGRPGTAYGPWMGDDDAYLAEYPNAVNHGYWPYRKINLKMKWSDTWLANTDCNGDGSLDRGYSCGGTSSACPGAWLTNHAKGVYFDGTDWCETTEFVKIIAPPTDAINTAGIWYAVDGTEIGPDIWGGFAIIQQKLDDPCGGYGGNINYKSPDHPGFGGW